ncbi:MAG: SpoIIIAH-like family protein [Clostridia bacterium]|nr:SpoIIIAH-like family protein [Clostridia bacterium]
MMKKVSKFFRGIRGKQILVSGLAVMVIAAGYYRWMGGNSQSVPVTNDALPQEEKNTEIAVTEDLDYFARARYERDCARSEAVELLSVSSILKENGTALKDKIESHAKNAESEATIENMVKSKGYDDCVAFIDEDGVRVVVKAKTLEASGVSKIKDIVVEQTGASPTKIRISSKN